MANFSSSKSAFSPAQIGPGSASGPIGPAGNVNLGSLRTLSSGAGSRRAQLEALYRDVISCGDAARGWFDGPGLVWRAAQPAHVQAQAAMESLAVTARLLAVMNWLLDPVNAARVESAPPLPLKPLLHDDPLAFGDDHPLAATPGGAIARASRQLLARAQAICALHGEI